MTQTRCFVHGVDHESSTCPACEYAEEIRRLTDDLNQKNAIIRKQNKDIQQLRAIVDLEESFTQAAAVLGEDDALWLKEQLYRYKLDRNIALKVITADKGPAGFMVLSRETMGREPAHICTSIGGVGLANVLDEANSKLGPARAMDLMTSALWKLIRGGFNDQIPGGSDG